MAFQGSGSVGSLIPSNGNIISILWQKFTYANFTTRPKKKGLHVGNSSKKQAPLRVVDGEAEGLRRKELLQ
jgi:hypothetical protein